MKALTKSRALRRAFRQDMHLATRDANSGLPSTEQSVFNADAPFDFEGHRLHLEDEHEMLIFYRDHPPRFNGRDQISCNPNGLMAA